MLIFHLKFLPRLAFYFNFLTKLYWFALIYYDCYSFFSLFWQGLAKIVMEFLTFIIQLTITNFHAINLILLASIFVFRFVIVLKAFLYGLCVFFGFMVLPLFSILIITVIITYSTAFIALITILIFFCLLLESTFYF